MPSPNYTPDLHFTNQSRDIAPRMLNDNVLQAAENIVFENGIIKQRYGIQSIGIGTLPLNGAILHLDQYRQLRSDFQCLVCNTKTDIYIYNVNRGRFEFRTRNYATGTVTTSSTGYRTVTLSGGTWDNTNWSQTNLYEISFDSATLENCTTWYTVAQITGATTLTLAEDAVSKTTSVYCLRLCYASDDDSVWHSCMPYDKDVEEVALLCTNGVDPVQKYSGTGYFANLTAYTDRCQFIGAWGSTTYNHIFCVNIYDAGSGYNLRQRIDISDAGELTWTNATYVELLDNNEPLVGMLPLNDLLIFYKNNSISVGQINANGGNEDPILVSENKFRGIGTPAIKTVVDIGSGHLIFTGRDIVFFNGFQYDSVAKGNIQYILKNLNKNYQHKAYAFHLQELKLYCLFLPFGTSTYCDTCIVYNYEDMMDPKKGGSFTYWTFTNRNDTPLLATARSQYVRAYAPRWCDMIINASGTYTSGSTDITLSGATDTVQVGMRVKGTNVYDVSYVTALNGSVATLDHATTGAGSATALKIGWTAAQMGQRWNELLVYENYTRMIFGDAAGDIYEFASEYFQDEDSFIGSTFTTKDYDLNKAGFDFTLLEAILTMQLKDGYTPATIDLRASIDFGRNWTAWQTIALDGNESYMEKKAYYNIKGKQARFELRFSNPMIFEALRIGFAAQYRSLKFDN